MKRASLLVLTGTVAGFAGVLTFHTHPASPASLPASGSPPGGTQRVPSGRASPASPAAARPATARPDPASPAPASPAIRSATGPAVPFGYGALSVRVVVRGTQITDVSVPAIQTAEPTSQQISTQAIPTLRAEVLSAQGASIDGVSGATYTSQAYVRSLQAALDDLHLR
jgi:uncharacterized protein with FMN-binding domain